jgi:uncharacterized protein DUF4303
MQLPASAPTREQLIEAIVAATRSAIRDLQRERPEHFYYCALVTTGEALSPAISAWSYEALEIAAQATAHSQRARRELKWSYADSPYFPVGEKHFAGVRALFSLRLKMVPSASQKAWDAEWHFRVDAMEAAWASLDAEGFFGTGAERNTIVINVEVAPPDGSNTVRARRLNPPEALAAWLLEAAEP